MSEMACSGEIQSDAGFGRRRDRVRRDTEAKRAQRAATVKDIEASIKTTAEKHIAEGLFDAPVLSVSCDPVGGGSTDDLTAKTTVFECFVATKNNGDGTLSGKKYHATMNWDTDNHTYGFGPPRGGGSAGALLHTWRKTLLARDSGGGPALSNLTDSLVR